MLNSANTELLQIVEAVAKEKGISRDLIVAAIEEALITAARKKYGIEQNIKAELNRKNGEVKLYRLREVVNLKENDQLQIEYSEVIRKDPTIEVGQYFIDPLPPIEIDRINAKLVKDVIVQKVKEAECEKHYNDFKNRVGEILNGTVKRVEFNNIIVEIQRVEGIIRKDQQIKSENYRINSNIKALVQQVKNDSSGPQIIFSRADNLFLSKLLEAEVPEIYDKVIEIKSVARDPGSKAKVAVFTSEMHLDAVGSCIGPRGSRIRAVSSELSGEKIDVIQWSNDIAQYSINALAPANITKVVIDENKHKVEVILPQDQLSIAIGRRGQNVRLASQLIGWRIDILTEEQESKRRVEEFNSSTELFIKYLDVEEVIAQLLVSEGFTSIDQIAMIDSNILANIEGFDNDLAQELQTRAKNYLSNINDNIIDQLENLGVEQELIDILVNFSPEHIVSLAENGIKTVEDLNEIDLYEFKSIIKDEIDDQYIIDILNFAKESCK